MNHGKQLNKSLLLIGMTLIFVLLLSFLPQGIKIFGYEIKPVDMFMDVKPDSLLTRKEVYRSEFFTAALSSNLIDKLLTGDKEPVNSNSTTPVPAAVNVEITGNTDQMKYFYDALRKAGSEKIRIAHFGDSEIEGDMITADLRQSMQGKFGGAGAGFLSITSYDINFRTTTKHSFSDNWKKISVVDGNSKQVPMGINGFAAIPGTNSWVKYEATGRYSNLKNFSIVRVFYTGSGNGQLKYQFDNKPEQTLSLKGGSGLQELELKANGSARSVKISPVSAEKFIFYGVSLENGNGVYADNFPWRGNSGVGFNDLDEKILKDFNNALNYKLILLNFGGNMIDGRSDNFDWYENQMVKIVNNLKKIFPQTSIVILGVGDKSMKKGTKFVTDPQIPMMIKAQKSAAERSGAAFWNLFEAMGGENSMANWVNLNPPLAFKDYTHFTIHGGKKIADLLSEALMKKIK